MDIKKLFLLVTFVFSAVLSFSQQNTLDFYINIAIKNSPLIKDYQNKTASNNIDIDRIKATYKPQVLGISSNSLAPVIGGWGYDAGLTNIASVNEFVNINKSFVSKNNLETQFKAINLISDSLQNAQKITEQDIKRTITSQYITIYGDQQQLLFYNEVLETLKRQEVVIKNLAENNIYRQTDFLTFEVTLKQQELQLKQLKIQIENDFGILNYLCGIISSSDSVSEFTSPELVLQQFPDESSSVFFVHFKTDSSSVQNSLQMLNFSYLPKVSVFANAGFSSTLQYFAYKNFGYCFGFNVSVPLYDGHQKQLLQQKINYSGNSISAYKSFFKKQYLQEINRLKRQLSATELLLPDINNQIQYAETLINVNKKLIETGDAKIADFVIAINTLLTAKNLLTQNNISKMQIINQLNYWNR